MSNHQSESIAELAAALSKAQAQIEGAKQDSKNPFFKSDYADLTSVWAACRKPLTDHGLAIIQTVEPREENKMVLITTLAHASGQWIKSYLPLVITKMDPQGVGASITYARRFALAAIVGICPKDDDAEEIMKPVREQEKLSNQQIAILDSFLDDDASLEEKIKKQKNLKSVYDLKPNEFDGLIKWLNGKKEKHNEPARMA